MPADCRTRFGNMGEAFEWMHRRLVITVGCGTGDGGDDEKWAAT